MYNYDNLFWLSASSKYAIRYFAKQKSGMVANGMKSHIVHNDIDREIGHFETTRDLPERVHSKAWEPEGKAWDRNKWIENVHKVFASSFFFYKLQSILRAVIDFIF